MAYQLAPEKIRRAGGIVCVLTAGLLGSGCAQHGELPSAELINPGQLAATSRSSEPAASGGKGPVTEQQLAEAADFWGKRYAEAPSDLEAALSYARNLKAMGRKSQALEVLQQASVFHADNRELAGEYGRLALDLGQIGAAEKLLAFADDPAKPNWRVISARGTVLAKQGKYTEAIPFFERALTLAHNHPSLLNNLALAHAMTGDAKKAEGLLRQAAHSGESNAKVRQNLALVLGLQGKYQESTTVAARDLPAATAAEDTAYLRKLTKLNPVTPAADDVQVARVELRGSTIADDRSPEAGWGSKVVSADNP